MSRFSTESRNYKRAAGFQQSALCSGVSKAVSVSRYLRRNQHKAKRWRTFLNNHREVIVAFDFFTVPTLMFKTLYCFFVIEHGRRRILHFNCTTHPTSEWIVQQLS